MAEETKVVTDCKTNDLKPEKDHINPEVPQECLEEQTSIFVKTEPDDSYSPRSSYQEEGEKEDTGSDDESLATKSNRFETVTVKVEPLSFESDDIDIKLEASSPDHTRVYHRSHKRKSKSKAKVDSDDDDDDYQDKTSKGKGQRKKKKAEPKYKPTYRLKKNGGDQTYSEDITKQVQIVQISEEERRQEHAEALNSRSHCKFLCVPCAIGYVLEDAYLMHMNVHSPANGDHECDVCRSRHRTPDNLYSHRLRHYRRYRCAACGALHKDRDAAACHVMTTHARKAFVCEQCGQEFKRPQYLKGHIEEYHTKQKSYECPVCQRVYHERGRWRCHVRNHNLEVRPQIGQFTCEVCDKKLRSKAYLSRHMTTMHSENSRCALCGEQCKSKEKLGRHLRVAHGATDCTDGYPCGHCCRVLTTQSMLARHELRMHLDRTKRFQCDYCQRLYYTKAEVRSHIMWTHLRARGGHACACGRVFRTPARLREHRARAHLGLPAPRDHPCPLCGKAFQNKQLLTRHMKVHSDEKYPCGECGLTFKTEGYVKVHYKLKHLNMTRAEIKAQSRRPKPVTIEQGMLLKNVGVIDDMFASKLGSSGSGKVGNSGSGKVGNSGSGKMGDSGSGKVGNSGSGKVGNSGSGKVGNSGSSKMENASVKASGDIQVPLFETFIDIQRD